MISWSAAPAGTLLAAPLADRLFKPMLAEGSPLAGSLGRVFGVGPSRGIGLQLTVVGLLTSVVAVIAMLSRRIRRVEIELPDAARAEAAGTPSGADSEHPKPGRS